MKRIDEGEYIVSDDEQVTITVKTFSTIQQGLRVKTSLDGESLTSANSGLTFSFTAQRHASSHHLLMYLSNLDKDSVDCVLLLTGSENGQFQIEMKINAGEEQARFLRFRVKGGERKLGIGSHH